MAVCLLPGTELAFTDNVRYDNRWTVVAGDGCIRPTPGGWTEVDGAGAGALRLKLRLVGNGDAACREVDGPAPSRFV